MRALLRSRTGAAIEVGLVVLIAIGHRVLRVIPFDETLPIVALGWLSLRLRGLRFKDVGFTRPAHPGRVVALGAGAGVLLQVLSEWVVEPVILRLTHETADLSEFAPLVGWSSWGCSGSDTATRDWRA